VEVLDKILNASITLFRQYGLKTVTMDDIARQAGISKKTLYQHFAHKQEVVSESIVWYKKSMQLSCASKTSAAENAVEEMVLMLAFVDDANKQINPIALFEMQRYFPEAYSIFRSLLNENEVAMIRRNIERGIAEGLYRPEINAELMARLKLETSLLILQPSLLVNDRYNLMAVSLEIGEHFLYGIMTQNGIELYQKKYKAKHLKQATTL
jgi:TetR/AcrR family transcriptional regulator, cholesterol catabolism regulator